MSLRRPPAPWWLAGPSRWAAIPRTRALAVAGFGTALLIVAVTLAARGVVPAGDAEIVAHRGIVEGLRHGGLYYPVAADALAEVGLPVRGAAPPVLAVVEAHLPFWFAIAGLWWLAAGVVLAWWVRLAPMLPGIAPRVLLAPLLAAGLAIAVRPDLAALPEPWAGLLVALALARRRRGRWGEAAAVALAAALIRETAAVAMVVMLWAAWREGEPREAAGWVVALLVLAIALWCHDRALAAVAGAGIAAGPAGLPATLAALAPATAFAALPATVAVASLGLALFGWWSWGGPLGTRVAATIAATLALLAVSGGVSPWRALVVAPLLPLGLIALPDALRDLVRAGLDTRRIVVRRAVR